MKALCLGVLMALTVPAAADTVAYKEAPDPSWDPAGSDVHMAYEWSTFDPRSNVHAPGAVLSAPGDSYSYTVLMADEFAGNADYEILRAIIGVHIDDSDAEAVSEKWGSILVNGKALPFMVMNPAKDKRTGAPTDHVAIISDAALTGKPGSSTPPYIYDVKAIIEAGEDVQVAITNLNKAGGTDRSAPFGGFVVNRIGAHVWYKRKSED